jgi:arylsulfatase A-like enzyme
VITRNFRVGAVLVALASLAAFTGAAPARSRSGGAEETARKRPPNILLIVTDDQRDTPLWDMPATRRYFQKGGVDYTNAFVTTPLCCPSRSSIMTGRYVHNHGVHGNGLGPRLDDSTTVQRYLHRAGYRTALIGKYLNSWGTWKPPRFWDRFAYFLPWGNKYYGASFNIDGKLRETKSHSNRFMAKYSVRLMQQFERNDDAPWFIYVAPKAPHMPFRPAPKHRAAKVRGFDGNPAAEEAGLEDKPPWIRSCTVHCGDLREGRMDAVRQQRTLLSVDDLVRDVFRQMDRLDEDRTTLAFYMSDNGYMWGEHGMIGKGQPYEQSVRIPLYARWPGHLPAGTRDHRLVANIDIAPTIFQASGARPSHSIDGRSLLREVSRDHLLMESLAGGKDGWWGSVRTATERYTEYYNDAAQERLAFREYYDLSQDPWELDNVLYSKQAEAETLAAELAALLDAAKTCAGTACP